MLRRILLFFAIALLFTRAAHSATGELELTVTDGTTGLPIAARMTLKDVRGRVRKIPGTVQWKDHFVFRGKVLLKLPPGTYTFELQRGPEYHIHTGHFTLKGGDSDTREVVMNRFVDMKKEGWWSGDLHIHRKLDDIKILMEAEDLHVGPVITWWNKQNYWLKRKPPETQKQIVRFDQDRYYHMMAGEDERAGGAVLFFNLNQPLPITAATKEYPSSLKFIDMAARQENVHIDVEKPFWWDMPVMVASGQVHSIGLAHNHMHHTGVLDSEAWGKSRDKLLYPGKIGNGRWTTDIYYHLLNAGLRIPPSAGSASGVMDNPVGYNRVYVFCGKTCTYQSWWEGLRSGSVMVTNGPMLRPNVEGKLPGHVFHGDKGETRSVSISLNLATRDKIDYLEVIKNGEVAHEVRLADWKKAKGKLPLLDFEKSGWFLIRAVSNNSDTYRFASTGPYYVEIGYEPHISRKSCKFFYDWVYERARQIKLTDPTQKAEVIAIHRKARDFWKKRLDQANVE